MRLITIIAVVAGLTCSPSFAADEAAPARKINFGVVITDIDGKPFNWDCKKVNAIDDKKCDEYRPMTLALLASTALLRIEPTTPGTDQIHRSMLAQEIYKGGELALDAKDTALVGDVVATFVAATKNSAIVTLRAWELIDPARLK